MIHLSPSDLRSIESSATAAAHYLDACDFGARSVKLDPTYYRACALRIQAGGDHGFQGFAERIPALLAFAGFDPALWRDHDFSDL